MYKESVDKCWTLLKKVQQTTIQNTPSTTTAGMMKSRKILAAFQNYISFGRQERVN